VIAEKAGLPAKVIEGARQKTTNDKLTLDSLLQQLHQKQQELKRLALLFDEKQLQAEASKTKYDELYEKWKQRMEKKNASAEDDHKLMELGKKFKGWMKEWESSTVDKKAVLQKITKAMSAEKLKKINKAQEAKKEKKRIEVLEKKKLQIVVGSKVKLLKGRQTGLVEEIQGNKAKVMFGNLKTIASLESLEAVE
jgi:dsDNA-specific endonuclease/ATPase MutS2